MLFEALPLEGAWIVAPQPHSDERGSFTRTFCGLEFRAHGLNAEFVQHSIAQTYRKGTMRGLHFQREPHAEVKLVRCIAGAVYDVIVDLRPGSLTFLRWVGVELSAENGRAIYVPKGFAHGCQTLTDDVAVQYLISEPYAPEAAHGIRYDDPAIGARWPLPVSMISQRDQEWPPLM
jgi:dTDP-4-dehydrorhamnose 3,5-epimerase